MTPDNIAGRIRREAAAKRADPGYALRCIQPALQLAETLGENDRVIWPIDQGGTAWEAVAAKTRRKTAGSGSHRILCVAGEDFPETPRLWTRLAAEAKTLGIDIVKIRLRSAGGVSDTALPVGSLADAGSVDRTPDNHRFGKHGKSSAGPRDILVALLDRFRRALARKHPGPCEGSSDSPGTEDSPAPGAATFPNQGLFMEMVLGDSRMVRADAENAVGGRERGTPGSARAYSSIPEAYRNKTGAGPGFFSVDQDVDIRERYFAAKAAAAAGLLPVVTLFPDEAHECAFRHARFVAEGLSVLTRVVENWNAVGGSVGDGTVILAPASENDLSGALEWYSGQGGAALIIEPGTAHSTRISMKERWSNGKGVVVRRKTAGSAGRIALIAPGFLTHEASKAADRLSKANLSVTVCALRFLAPLRIDDLLDLAAEHDLVCIVDPTSRRGGFLSGIIEAILLKGETPLVLPNGPFDGRSIAEAAEKAHRENRFRRAVDDVRRDKWR